MTDSLQDLLDQYAPPVEVERPTLNLRWIADTLDTPPPEPPILVDGLLRKGELCVIGAPRAIGKTWLGMNLAVLLSNGKGLFLGNLPIEQPAKVLYCQGELDEWGSWTRWNDLTLLEGRPANVAETFDRWRLRVATRRITTVAGEGVNRATQTDEYIDATLDQRIEQAIKDHQFDVLIIDPWATYFAGKENSNDEAEAGLDKLRDLAHRYGLAVVIIHHVGKATDAREPEDLWRGASRLADWASTRVTVLPHYTAKQAKDQGMTRVQARRYADVHFLRRSTPTEDFSMRLDGDGWWREWVSPEDMAAGRAVHIEAVDVGAALDASGGVWNSIVEAATALGGVATDTAKKQLTRAVQAGEIEPFDGPHGAKGHRRPGAHLPTV